MLPFYVLFAMNPLEEPLTMLSSVPKFRHRIGLEIQLRDHQSHLIERISLFQFQNLLLHFFGIFGSRTPAHPDIDIRNP